MQIGPSISVQTGSLGRARGTGVDESAGSLRGAASAGSGSDPSQAPALRLQSEQLAARDREVRAHEQAHLSAGGSLVTSGPSYSYQIGPDGRRYAIGGEVGIDTSPVRDDPQATLDKARRIVAAALAPAQPSAQDLSVAARATRMAAEARAEIGMERARSAYLDAGSEPAQRSSVSVRA